MISLFCMTRASAPVIAAPTATNTCPRSATLAAPPVLVSLAAEPVLPAVLSVVEILVEDVPEESTVVTPPVVIVATLSTPVLEDCFESVPVPVGAFKPSATTDIDTVCVCENVATSVPLWPDWYKVQRAEDPASIYSQPTDEELRQD